MSQMSQPASSVPGLVGKTPNESTDSASAEPADSKTWSQSARDTYDSLYTSWAPWAEDLYLRYFTRHNKASYATEDALQKTKVTGVKQVDTLQDGVYSLVGSQVGQGGLLQPVGDAVSHHGINRAEREGKDADGSYVPSSVSNAGSTVASGGKSAATTVGGGVKTGAESVSGGLQSGVKSLGGGIGLFGKG